MADEPTLTLDIAITRGESQVSTVMDGETVLMKVDSGQYFQLDDIGTRIWALIETPMAIGTLCDRLVSEFEVERATCETEVMALVTRLLANNLIRVAPPA